MVPPDGDVDTAQAGSWCEEELRVVQVQLWNPHKEEAYQLMCEYPMLKPRLQTDGDKEALKAFINSMQPMMLSSVKVNLTVDYEKDTPSTVVQKAGVASILLHNFITFQKDWNGAHPTKPAADEEMPKQTTQAEVLTGPHEGGPSEAGCSGVHDEFLSEGLQPLSQSHEDDSVLQVPHVGEGLKIPEGFSLEDVVEAFK